MIDFWFKTENEQITEPTGWTTNMPRFPDDWSYKCFSSYRKDDGTWVTRVYLPRDTWNVTIPSYGEHLGDNGAATSIANSSPNDWTASEVNESFKCGVESTHYEPSDT